MKNYSLLSRYRSQLFGISIIGIMIFHYFENVLNMTKGGITREIAYITNQFFGSIGVEVFLFLSGLGLYFSLSNRYNIEDFYKKRFVRILVPYLLYGCIIWFVTDVMLKDMSFFQYIYDLSLLSFWTSGAKLLWFIALIIPLYIAFPLIYETVNAKNGFVKTIALCLMLTFVLICAQKAAPDAFARTEIALKRIPIFIIGTYFGKLAYEKKEIRKSYYFWLLMGIPLKFSYAIFKTLLHFGILAQSEAGNRFSDLYEYLNRYINSYYAISLIFLCILLLKAIHKITPIDKIFCYAGTISLELYIVHVTIRGIFILKKFEIYRIEIYAAAMALSVIIAILLHMVSNKLINKLLHKNNKKRNT